MDKKSTIETIGYVFKEEKLATLNHNIIPNTFVLETEEPYPGYHGKDLPGASTVPEFVFFVTKNKLTTEQIERITNNIRKYFEQKIDVARAEINIFNNTFSSIRIKDCKDLTQITELQSCFKSEGVEFAKSRSIDSKGLIKIQKHFHLEETSEGVYKDLNDSDTFYLQIPAKLNWEQFRAITLKIKNSQEVSNFDAALGLFYRQIGVVDVVRIYDKGPTDEKLNNIRTRYLNEVKKLVLNNFSE